MRSGRYSAHDAGPSTRLGRACALPPDRGGRAWSDSRRRGRRRAGTAIAESTPRAPARRASPSAHPVGTPRRRQLEFAADVGLADADQSMSHQRRPVSSAWRSSVCWITPSDRSRSARRTSMNSRRRGCPQRGPLGRRSHRPAARNAAPAPAPASTCFRSRSAGACDRWLAATLTAVSGGRGIGLCGGTCRRWSWCVPGCVRGFPCRCSRLC
jgi:hypothetical protein